MIEQKKKKIITDAKLVLVRPKNKSHELNVIISENQDHKTTKKKDTHTGINIKKITKLTK